MSQSASGKVSAFDQADRTVTFENGTVFHIAPATDMTAVRAGDFIYLEYDDVPEHRDNPQPSDPPMRSIRLANVVSKSPSEALSPNLLTRGPLKPPKPAVNTTASLKTKA